MSKVPSSQNNVSTLYKTVIEDVINNIRETFLEDGVDEQVLQELKNTWESKVIQSKAIERRQEPQRHLTQQMYLNAQVFPAMPGAIPTKTVQMTTGGQQAALALPSNLIYQQKLPTAITGQSQIYNSYQPSHQIVQQSTVQKKTVTTTAQGKEQVSSSGSQQPAVIIQVDGASDALNSVPGCSSAVSTLNQKPSLEHIMRSTASKLKMMPQVDGGAGSSSEDDDSDDDDDDDEEEDEDEEGRKSSEAVDFEPLCSDDDDEEEDPVELFDTDNVIVCQYDKIHRAKARWKFHLKVGIMNLNGHDYVFQKATGEADW
ncbi:transcription initiation factor IIA subunit 1-like [Clavelina lepadiformis]|uniref:transcription initiation factor IIA subunit 1-like n=1 Tax=Clavelina lepadiformis TaxID=159417 RepID=UPI004043214E